MGDPGVCSAPPMSALCLQNLGEVKIKMKKEYFKPAILHIYLHNN